MIKPIERKKTYTMILQELINFIRSQKLQKGDQIPTERQLAEMMKVSRPVIREAISILEWLGVVESKQGSGIRLLKLPGEDYISPSSVVLFSDQEGIHELLEARKLLEAGAAFFAAERKTQEDLQRLKNWLDASINEIEKGNVGLDELFNFHRSIIIASHNTLLVKIFDAISETLRQAMKYTREYSRTLSGEPKKVIKAHVNIFCAIENGDCEGARNAVSDHLEYSKKKLFTALGKKIHHTMEDDDPMVSLKN